MDKNILIAHGINYDKGLNRFMDDKELYDSTLLLFLEDKTMKQADKALKDGDYSALFEAMQAFKGLTGNLDITDCYILSGDIVEMLRPQKEINKELLSSRYQELKDAYNKAIEGIKLADK